MTFQPTSAADHYRDQQKVTAAAILAAGNLWGSQPPSDFDAWFEANATTLVGVVSAAQARAVRGGSDYVQRALSEINVQRDPEASIDPSGLVGVASDGRPLESLLYGSVITAKGSIAKAGKVDERAVREAWKAGRTALETRVLTQVADAGRSSTMLELTVRPGVGYTRLVRVGGCSRCSILAGRFYRWSDGFLRHPRCMCRHIPATDKVSEDLVTDPREAFDALSEDQQNKIYTRAGADAIRGGANIAQVVNVRRGNSGLQTGAGRITRTNVYGQDLFTSTEGTTKRGFAGKLIRSRGQSPATTPRLMPETIAEIAEDRDDYLRLLELNGYAFDRSKPGFRGSLTPRVTPTPTPRPVPKTPSIDLDVPKPLPTPKPELTAEEKKAARLAAKLKTAANKVAKSQAALDELADATTMDAMPLHARAIVDRAELRKLEHGKPADISDVEKLARKLVDVESKVDDPEFDIFYLSSEIGSSWANKYRDEWRRNLQDAMHLAGDIVVAPTKEWPIPGLKRKSALELHRTSIERDVRETNPKYFSGAEYQINCQRVVQAYELRHRGYDVTANPNYRNHPTKPNDKGLTDEAIFGGWTSTGQPTTGVNFTTATSAGELASIAQAWGPGTRGWITVDWQAPPGQPGSAHIFNFEVAKNGRVRFYDAQTGESDASAHLARIDFNSGRGGARIYRVDDKLPVDSTRTLVSPARPFIMPTEEVPQ
ncbi:toxin glutamine deamidase domain-containing protein [Rhodococcoides fascians]|uniref:toxin glutamine deamidase domain-containing protein n=1 Tax=Rhodococcoides fascians TaxID=1828 RepID=UPI00068E085F|nr:toxin glutamine deamidase domain-containing protein [Rhodococcus fascians]